MKEMRKILIGLTMSVLVSACGGQKTDNGSKAPPPPPPPAGPNQAPPAPVNGAPNAPVNGGPNGPNGGTNGAPNGPLPPSQRGELPADGSRIGAPGTPPQNQTTQNPLIPGVPYSPTPLPLPGTRGPRVGEGGAPKTGVDPNLTPQERQEIEQEAQRRRRRQEEQNRRTGQTDEAKKPNKDRSSANPPQTSAGGVESGPTPLPPSTKKSNEQPPISRPVPVEEASGPAWSPPQAVDTPAAAWLHYKINPLLNSVKNAGPAPKVLANRVKVTIALGYFDGFHAEDLKYENENYGRHVAVDPFLRGAVDAVLTRDCGGQRLQVCGFELKAINDVEATYMRGGVDGLIQEIRVLSGAIDPRYKVTTGALAAEQKKRSARAAAAFSKSFLDSDLVVYVGHSRLGGGPDFEPPRLKNNKVDYASYQTDRPGARRTLRAVKDPNRRTRAFALLSCDSTDHFLGEIRKASPDLQLATMKGAIKSEDQMAAGLLAVDLFLRQGSLNGYKKFLSGSPALSEAVTVAKGKRAAGR